MNREDQVNHMIDTISEVLGFDDSNERFCEAYENVTRDVFPEGGTEEEQEAWSKRMDGLFSEALIALGKSTEERMRSESTPN